MVSAVLNILHLAAQYISVIVTKILHPRQSGIETWLTSDGRAYLVQLYESPDVRGSSDSRRVVSYRVTPISLARAYSGSP